MTMGFLQTTVTETKTADFTPGPAATIYLVDATTGDITVTMPSAAADANSVYELRRIDATGHTVTLAGAADDGPTPPIQDYVNGLSSITLAANSGIALVSDGVSGWHSLSTNSGGGGGSLDAGSTVQGTDPNSALLTLTAADGQAAPYLVVKRDANWQGGTMIEGQDETSAQLWYADENGDVSASHNLYAGNQLYSAGVQTTGNSTIGGSLGVASLNSSGAIAGASATLSGALAAGSATITGAVGGGSFATAAGLTVGTSVQAGDGSSAGVLVNADGSIQVFDGSEPGTPDSGIVLWSASGVLKWKGPDGVVH